MKSDDFEKHPPHYPENISILLTYLERLAESTARSAKRECVEDDENASNDIKSRLTRYLANLRLIKRSVAAPQLSQNSCHSAGVMKTLAILEKMFEDRP